MTSQALENAVRSRGFTPSVRDAPALVAMLASDDEGVVRDVERAIGRLGASALRTLLASFDATKAPLRARVTRAIGRLAPESGDALAFLVRAVTDDDAKTRRNALGALGKVPGSEDILVEAWAREPRVDHKRTIAASLGKVGGARALELLSGERSLDPELSRILGQAVLMLQRTTLRSGDDARAGGIDASRAATVETPVLLHCRVGLEQMLEGEAGVALGARVVGLGCVRVLLRGKLEDLFALRTMHHLAFPLLQQRLASGEDVGHAVVRAITSPEARRIFDTWTTGPIRYRIAWSSGGHLRAVVWRCAQEIARARPDLVNDPTESTWEIVATRRGRFVDTELVPRALEDPRFAYRVADVPAASHPPLAAALVRIAGTLASDVVWDPFCGSGVELVERARGGPYARMFGSDIDEAALAAAQKNLDAAGVRDVTLGRFDGTTHVPSAPPDGAGVSLILTNPPMGRRVARQADLGQLMDRFIDHVAVVLAPGGRLAWVSPMPERTRARAERGAMRVEHALRVDMGGFTAEIQLVRRCGA